MPAITIPGTSIKYGWQEREKGWGPGMNTNLLVLGVIAKGQIVSRTTNAPPANPDEGDAYIIPADATGTWSGRENEIAAFFSDAWVYIEPVGSPMYVLDEDARVFYDGTAWSASELPQYDFSNQSAAAGNFTSVADADKLLGVDVSDSDTPKNLTLLQLAASQAMATSHVKRVTDLAALRAVTGMQANQTVEMVTTGRAGLFRWDDSDLSAEVTADTQMGIYVPPTGQDGSSGAWVRVEGSILPEPVTVTVGTGGTFATINAAISYLSTFAPIYNSVTSGSGTPVGATIKLLAGFIMAEQVEVEGIDLGWITIESTDAEVTITRSALTSNASGRYAAFAAFNGATLPRVAALFSMDSSGTATERDGVFITGNSFGDITPTGTGTGVAGVKNAGARGLHVTDASVAKARGANFSGAADIGARISNGSLVQGRGSDFSSCNTGCSVNGSVFNATSAIFDSATTVGINADASSIVHATNASATACGTYGIYCNGAHVFAQGADISGSLGVGALCENGGLVMLDGADVSSATTDALSARQCGVISAPSIIANGAGNSACFATTGASVYISGNCTNATSEGLDAARGAKITAFDVDLTGAGVNCVKCISGAEVKISNSLAEKTSSSPVSSDIIVATGGQVSISATTGGTNQTPNILTAAGIIMTSDVVTNDGTATITTAATSVSVTHGLSFTPTLEHIQVTPTNNLGDATKFWISSPTSTTFDINVDAAPTSSDATFAWRAEYR